MNFILLISKEMKWKVKVVLLKVSLMNFSLDIQGDQMQSESGVTRSIIYQYHSSDMIKGKVEVVLLEV